MKKMFNSDAQDSSGGQPSIASLMAKEGRMTENEKVIIPNVSASKGVESQEPKSVEPTMEVRSDSQPQVPETKDDKGLYAIGSGGTLALGALAALESETKTHAKASGAAKKAINIAIQYNVWCGGTATIKTQFTK